MSLHLLPPLLNPIRAAALAAQRAWRGVPVSARLRLVRRLRRLVASAPDALVAAVRGAGSRPAAEIFITELLPFAEACRFLEREAQDLLSPRALGGEGRRSWLGAVASEIRREPLGVVLIVAPAHDPLFLPGVQALQALVAGNAVLWKPGPGGSGAARVLATLAREAGLPSGLLQVLDETPEAAQTAIAAGIDKVLFTGSAATGRQVLAQLAPHLTPAALELSGCAPLLILPGADLDRVARAIAFRLRLQGWANRSALCRVFVPGPQVETLEHRLRRAVAPLPPVPLEPSLAARVRLLVAEALAEGASLLCGNLEPTDDLAPLVVSGVRIGMRLLREDLFAPVAALVPVSGVDEALAGAGACPFALGASVFGPEDEAREVAARLDAGVVTVNDLIVPTADPRIPFGGRRESGFGVTRGAEGLLALTVPKVVQIRRGRSLRHLAPPHPLDAPLFRAFLALAHGGGFFTRMQAAGELVRALAGRVRSRRKREKSELSHS